METPDIIYVTTTNSDDNFVGTAWSKETESCGHVAYVRRDLIEGMIRDMKERIEQEPAKWSEEDADILNCCISSIEEAKENRYAYKETDGDTSYDHEIAWLKSLRPVSKESLQSWKPNEEQMKEFLATHPEIKVPEKYKNPDWLFKKQEKPEVDFEKEWDEFEDWMESYITSDYPTYYAPKDIARHFYELGSQSKPEVFDTVAFQRGVQEGRRLEREDVKSTIQSRIDEILGDAQPNPILRMELQELIKKIES